tara:strand:+ start:704 stop:2779 length:2076 start_codon:yes stop_codon:yes gene_type:complete
MGITVRELVTKLGFTTDTKKLDEFNNKINLAKKRLQDLSDKSTKVGRSLSFAITLPLIGLSTFALKAASDAEEIRSKYGTVFQDMRDQSEKTAKQLAKDFGLSGTKARELLGNTGDLLTGFGFSQESALDLSKQVNELAVDLASFTNFSGGAEGASSALTKALLGEREALKSLGVSVIEEDVKTQVAINSSNGMTFATERQAKAYATLVIAQNQSKNAIGDFARTSTSFANRLRIFRARLQDVAEVFGSVILPPATKLLNKVISMMEKFAELSSGTQKTILVFAGLAAVIGPLFLIFGFFAGALVKIVSAYHLLTKAVLLFRTAALSAHIAAFAIPAAIAAAVAAVILIIDDLVAFFQGRDSVTSVIVNKFQEITPKVIRSFKEVFERSVAMVKAFISKFINAFQSRFPALYGLVDSIMGFWLASFKFAFTAIKTYINIWVYLFMRLKSVAVSVFTFIVATIKESIGLVKADFEVLKNILISPFIGLKGVAVSAFTFIIATIKQNTGLIKSAFGVLKNILISPFIGLKNTIESVFDLIDKILKSKIFSKLINGPTEVFNKATGLLNKLSGGEAFEIIGKVSQAVTKKTDEGYDFMLRKPSVIGFFNGLTNLPIVDGLQNAQNTIAQNTTPASSSVRNNKSSVFNIKIEAPIQVDQKTSVQNIGTTIQRGLESGLERVLRQTARANAPVLEF